MNFRAPLDKVLSIKRYLRENSVGIESNELSRLLDVEFRQNEALQQLNKFCDFKFPIPKSRGWAASPDFLLEIFRVCKVYEPKIILDLGSGLTTLVAAKSSLGTVVSLEQSHEHWVETGNQIDLQKIENVDLRFAPIDLSSNNKWYPSSSYQDLQNIDFLIIDGPSADENPSARMPAFDYLLGRLSPNCVILIDDAGRMHEKELGRLFSNHFSSHRMLELDFEKKAILIKPCQ